MKSITRSNLLWLLVIATAVSACLQYVMQGLLATGRTPDFFGEGFFVAESVLWGFRAIVEAIVVAYLFSTKATTERQERMLNFMEISLITLIALTLGPALTSMGYGKAVKDIMPHPILFWLWNFGIASYAPAMMGSAAYAYKCDSGTAQVIAETPKSTSLTMDKGDLMARFIAILEDQDETNPLKQKEIAAQLGIAEPAMSKLVKQGVAAGVISKNGHLGLVSIAKGERV